MGSVSCERVRGTNAGYRVGKRVPPADESETCHEQKEEDGKEHAGTGVGSVQQGNSGTIVGSIKHAALSVKAVQFAGQVFTTSGFVWRRVRDGGRRYCYRRKGLYHTD